MGSAAKSSQVIPSGFLNDPIAAEASVEAGWSFGISAMGFCFAGELALFCALASSLAKSIEETLDVDPPYQRPTNRKRIGWKRQWREYSNGDCFCGFMSFRI